jgi:hypothetical protein
VILRLLLRLGCVRRCDYEQSLAERDEARYRIRCMEIEAAEIKRQNTRLIVQLAERGTGYHTQLRRVA